MEILPKKGHKKSQGTKALGLLLPDCHDLLAGSCFLIFRVNISLIPKTTPA